MTFIVDNSDSKAGKTISLTKDLWLFVNNKKMSKSENNFFTVRDILKEFNPIAVRLFMLSAHYANPINFSHDLLMQAQSALSRIDNCRENLKFIINGNYSRI